MADRKHAPETTDVYKQLYIFINYKCLSIALASSVFDLAPISFSTTSPFLNTIIVGMFMILNFSVTSPSLSTLSFATFALPSYSSASSSIIGLTALQGPHHGAQKSP